MGEIICSILIKSRSNTSGIKGMFIALNISWLGKRSGKPKK